MALRPTRSGFWLRLAALVRKEVWQLLRDKSNLAIGVVLPMVLILIFGFGISLDVRNAPVAVVLEDTSPLATESVSGVALSPHLEPVVVHSMREAESLLRAHAVDAIVRLPSDFSAGLAAGHARVQTIVHGTDAATARIIEGYLAGALAQPIARLADQRGRAQQAPEPGAAGRVTVEQRLWFNAANTSTWYLVPGLIVLIVTLVGAFLTSLLVAREWERGTLEALFVTPVRPAEILLAKMIPYFAIGLAGLAMCVLAARYLFGVPLVGSLAALAAGSVLYLLVALGLGLLISSVTKSQFLASQVALLTSFLPAVLLSGFIFDLRNAPAVVRAIGQALPATHFMNLVRTLFLAGDVWPLVLKECATLAVYAVVLLAAARAATRKRLA